MKNTINAAIIRNRYNVLADNATHEKAVLLSLLISCNIPYHMNNGHVVLDSKKGLKHIMTSIMILKCWLS